MRRLPAALFVGLLAFGPAALNGQTDLRPAPSGRGTSEVSLTRPSAEGQAGTVMKIRVDYGQPHLRGRTLHTDSLVPYDTPWRTGANEATTLTTELSADWRVR